MLKIKDLHKSYHQEFKRKAIIKGINFQVKKNEIVSIVGKSGCGKTTTVMCIAGFLPYEKGEIWVKGKCISYLKKKEKNILLRNNIQLIFQNCVGTLHPKKRIQTILTESIKSIERLTKKKIIYNIEQTLEKVDLNNTILNKYPADLSGGENQRVSIARALLVNPRLLIADEPISSSDVTTQAKMLNLFKTLPEQGISVLFITHDLAAAYYISDWIIVMNDGEIVEQNVKKEIFNNFKNPYTKELIKFTKTLIREEL